MDYDGKRHTVESLENAKKRDETKISKVSTFLHSLPEQHSVSLCVSVTVCVSLYASVIVCVSLSVSVPVCVFLSVSLCFCYCPCVPLCLPLDVCLSIYIILFAQLTLLINSAWVSMCSGIFLNRISYNYLFEIMKSCNLCEVMLSGPDNIWNFYLRFSSEIWFWLMSTSNSLLSLHLIYLLSFFALNVAMVGWCVRMEGIWGYHLILFVCSVHSFCWW